MDEERCVCCGKPVPEGRQVCWNCEHQEMKTGAILQTIEATEEDVKKAYDFLKTDRGEYNASQR